MQTWSRIAARALLAASAWLAATAPALADGTVGNTLPAGFPQILDASLNKPLLGFGAAGPVTRTPVVFVHGNNDTPYATLCNPYGRAQAFAQYLADHGYALSELWAVGYQGDQCDLLGDQTIRSSAAHTTVANVPDVRAFVLAVLRYTGASQVDIVAHSLGSVIVREWMRQYPGEQRFLRRFVAVDGANHGIINCSPNPLNFWQFPANGGFSPSSAICQELGSPNTPFLTRLNHGRESLGASNDTLVIRNADTGFVYFPTQDGILPGVPAEDSFGQPTDFSGSAKLSGAVEIDLTGQGIYDPFLGTTHLGIWNSPATRQATLQFLTTRIPGQGH